MSNGGWLVPFGRNPQVSSDEVQAAVLQALPSSHTLLITELESQMSPRYCRSAVQRALRSLVIDDLVEKTGVRKGMRYRRCKVQTYDPGPMAINRLYAKKFPVEVEP